MLRSILLTPLLATLAYALAVPRDPILARKNAAIPAEVEARAATVTALSASQLASYAPYTQFARAAYCPSSSIKTWGCGGMFLVSLNVCINTPDL